MNEDCGVCLSDCDYDAPAMYGENIVRARKPYKCCECGCSISIGQHHQNASGLWEGEWGSYRTCLDCMNIRDAFRCGGGFIFGMLWDSLHEYRNDVNSGCVAKIKTVSAKMKFMDWLREKRGIEA